MPIARRGTVGVATHPVPCSSSLDDEKPQAQKTKKVYSTLFHAKSITRIGCWNVRSLGSLGAQSTQLCAVLDTMKSKNIDLLCLSESRWPGNGVTVIRNSTIVHSGTPSTHVHGVAVILSPRAKAAWEVAGCMFQPVSERILRLRLKCHFGFVSVVSVYAPTNPTDSTSDASSPSEAFYDQLQSTLLAIPSSDMVVVMGDFNARVGSDVSPWGTVLGPHGFGDVNENGERLLDFCANNQLVLTNTWFQHKVIHKATWFRNGDRPRVGHMIDFVLVNKRFRNSVLDTRVYRSTLHESDHELVVSSLHFKIKAKRQQAGKRYFQTTNLSDECRAALANAFQKCDLSSSSSSQWASFMSSTQEACQLLPVTPRSIDPNWVTENLSEKKRVAWLRFKNASSSQDITHLRAEFNHLKKLTKDAAEKARNSWWSDRAAEAESRACAAESQGRGGSLIRDCFRETSQSLHHLLWLLRTTLSFRATGTN